jgi:hypothetical protein
MSLLLERNGENEVESTCFAAVTKLLCEVAFSGLMVAIPPQV